jgi:hypothetical protein
LINVEYFFVAVLALFVSRAIVGFVLALIFLTEIFHLAASTYYFSDADFLKSASYLSCLPIGRAITLSLILVLLVLAWTYIVLKLAGPHIHHDRRRSLAVLASAIVFLVSVDVATGNNTRLGLRDTSLDANVASGPMIGLIISVAADKLGGFGHSNKEVNEAASASAPLFAPLRAVKTTSGSLKARNVVLIVVCFWQAAEPGECRMAEFSLLFARHAEYIPYRRGRGALSRGHRVCGIPRALRRVGIGSTNHYPRSVVGSKLVLSARSYAKSRL